MAYDSQTTGLCFWTSTVILLSLSLSVVSQYQSQLGPLSVHFINKHDCPEVHAQPFIMRVSQAEGFVIDLIRKIFGVVLMKGGNVLSVTVSNHTEEVGMLETEILLCCVQV